MIEPNVLKVKPLSDYKVLITFDTGEEKIFDVSPYISGTWFGLLKDTEYFKTVHPVGDTIEWADGQDIAPHELYELSIPV